MILAFVVGFVACLVIVKPKGSRRKRWGGPGRGSGGRPWETKKKRTRKLI